MKKMKLSTFIAQLEKLKETKGDVEIYPVYHDDFEDNVKVIKRASIMTAAACKENFHGYNITEGAPKDTLFLVFED